MLILAALLFGGVVSQRSICPAGRYRPSSCGPNFWPTANNKCQRDRITPYLETGPSNTPWLISSNGACAAQYRVDGYFAVFVYANKGCGSTDKTIWKSSNAGVNGGLAFQMDGNIVMYVKGTPVWASGTHGRGAASVMLHDNCRLAVHKANGEIIWQTPKPSCTPTSPTCLACPAGKYQNNVGAKSCLPCPAGRYQSKTNAVTCLTTPIGRYQANQGATWYLDCQPGTYQPYVGQAACLDCPASRYQPAYGGAQCLNCPAGQYSKVGSGACETTATPTRLPSRVPSLVPTRLPSRLPTRAPTGIPTSAPTSIPTLSPTPLAITTKSLLFFGNQIDERTGRVHGKPEASYVDIKQCVSTASVVTQVHYYVARPLPATNLSVVFWRYHARPAGSVYARRTRVGATPILNTSTYGSHTRVLTRPIVVSSGDCLGWQRDGQGVAPYTPTSWDPTTDPRGHPGTRVMYTAYAARSTTDGQTITFTKALMDTFSFGSSYIETSTMGNPVSVANRSKVDTALLASSVDTRSCAAAPIVVVQVQYYVQTARPATKLRVVFWRPLGNARWRRVSATPVLDTSSAGLVTKALDSPISLKSGDCLGWQREGQGSVAYEPTSENRVQYTSANASDGLEVVFRWWSTNKYSIAATYVEAELWPAMAPTAGLSEPCNSTATAAAKLRRLLWTAATEEARKAIGPQTQFRRGLVFVEVLSMLLLGPVLLALWKRTRQRGVKTQADEPTRLLVAIETVE